jgi:hypothetical protein
MSWQSCPSTRLSSNRLEDPRFGRSRPRSAPRCVQARERHDHGLRSRGGTQLGPAGGPHLSRRQSAGVRSTWPTERRTAMPPPPSWLFARGRRAEGDLRPGPSPAFIRRPNRHGVSATVPWRIKICAGLAAVVESRELRRRPEGSAATPSTCREARSLRVLSIRPPVQPCAYSATLGPGAQRQATGHLHHVPPYRSEFGRSVRTQRGCAVDGCRVVRCEDHIGHRGRGD